MSRKDFEIQETRQRILSIVPRIAPTLLAEKDPHMIQQKLEHELILALDMVDHIEKIIDGSFQEEQQKEQNEDIENG